MSNGFIKKVKDLSISIKIIIITGIFAVIFLSLAIGAAFASPIRAKNAIDSIGTVAYTAESKEKIDAAILYYETVGANGLGESKHFGSAYVEANRSEEQEQALLAAKKEYVRLAIRAVDVAEQRRAVDHNTDEDIIKLIQQADAAVEEYFKGKYDEVDTYSTLVSYKEKYNVTKNEPSSGSSSQEEEVDIELC